MPETGVGSGVGVDMIVPLVLPTWVKSSINSFAKPLWNLQFVRYKIYRQRVNAVTRVLLCKTLADKNVSQVGAAVSTLNLRSHPIRVRQPFNGAGDFVVEDWPTTVRFKLILGTVKFGAAPFADVGAFLPKSKVFSCKRHFGAFVDYDLFFFRSEFLSGLKRSGQQNTNNNYLSRDKKGL